MTAVARRALSSVPSKTRSETTVSYRPPDLSPVSDSSPSSSEDESDNEDDWERLTMNPADIRVIQRLSKKANILPIVARADSLTNDKLTSIKKVIRRDLDAAGLDFGVFGPINDPLGTAKPEGTEPTTNGVVHTNGTSGHVRNSSEGDAKDKDDTPLDAPEERPSRAVIKLRPSRHPKPRRASHSRSRLELSESANEPQAAEIIDTESVASVRLSAQIVGKADLGEMLPFAVIAPEYGKRKSKSKRRKDSGGREGDNRISTGTVIAQSVSDDNQSSIQAFPTSVEGGVGSVVPSEDGHRSSNDSHGGTIQSPISSSPVPSSRVNSYLMGPPADLKGVFVRSYRWGSIDVLSPEHCDFAALRTAILSTHMKVCVFIFETFLSVSFLCCLFPLHLCHALFPFFFAYLFWPFEALYDGNLRLT